MKRFKVLVVLAIGVVLLAACAGAAGQAGPAGPQGPAGPAGPAGPEGPPGEAAMVELTCTECHNETSVITEKHYAWEESLHGSGEAFARGRSASCVGCHSGDGFVDMVAAGLNPGSMEAGDSEPTRQDCRTCHNIHMTYTGEDWALTTTDPVVFYAFEGVTFDGGKGNLCVNCHQPRRNFASQVTDGVANISSTHWGPHHGPQSATLLGLGGSFDGSPAGHATMVEDTCVTCHLPSHTFEPNLAACQECHADAENFDINGVQTEVQALLDELEGYLIAAGLLDDEGHPVVSEVPEAEGAALWNWIFLAHEDKSFGVHNPAYTFDLLEASLAVFK